jgi:general secretion pathway protein L
MRIGTFLRRWIEVLTSVYFACYEAWRARRSLIVSCESEHFTVRTMQPKSEADIRSVQLDEPGGTAALSVLAAGTPISPEMTRAARGSLIILELPADDVVVRRISVPAQAHDFLPGIVRNKLDRLSPWRADQSVSGFDADVSVEDPATLDVRVLIASRAAIDGVRDKLAAMGLAVDRVVTVQPNAGIEKSITLWSRLAATSREDLDRAYWRIGLGIAAVILVSFGLTLWAGISAASMREESDDIEARTKMLQRQIEGPRTPQSIALLNPSERAWYEKEASPTAAIVIEAVSRALPDAAYLTELHLENATLRMIGLTKDAPSLIAPLEHSGHLANVRFFAPTTRGTDGALFRFSIEAHVEPHSKIVGDHP